MKTHKVRLVISHLRGLWYLQNDLCTGSHRYTGPAALPIANALGPGQRPQENYEGNEQVFPQMEDHGDGPNYLSSPRFIVSPGSVSR